MLSLKKKNNKKNLQNIASVIVISDNTNVCYYKNRLSKYWQCRKNTDKYDYVNWLVKMLRVLSNSLLIRNILHVKHVIDANKTTPNINFKEMDYYSAVNTRTIDILSARAQLENIKLSLLNYYHYYFYSFYNY